MKKDKASYKVTAGKKKNEVPPSPSSQKLRDRNKAKQQSTHDMEQCNCVVRQILLGSLSCNVLCSSLLAFPQSQERLTGPPLPCEGNMQ